MLRVSEIRLPIDHPPEALPAAVATRLGIPVQEIGEINVFRRSCDARKASALVFSYSVDLTLPDEAQLLARFADRCAENP
jgi:uncharacterized protein